MSADGPPRGSLDSLNGANESPTINGVHTNGKRTPKSQYNNLLGKLTDMRTRLGTKLKQDANLDLDDLTGTVDTLKEELITSHQEAERTSKELDIPPHTDADRRAHMKALQRERELRETQLELERCRMERDEWERETMEGTREAEGLAAEQEKTGESDSRCYRTSKRSKDYEAQLQQVTLSLAEFKHRAHTAELKLEESQTNITRTTELENQVKEKNLLIGKLRHEGVIMNEHLVEALRRLRKNSSETNVDRRLVTNVLLSYITTPRGDTKRFEMLKLLSSILSWTEQEKEKAGIQKAGSGGGSLTSPSSGFWGRSLSSGGGMPAKSPIEKAEETESFSRLWTTGPASASTTPASRGNMSLPGSPATGLQNLSPPKVGRRLSSLSAIASTPDLTALPGSRKGKEREHSIPLPGES
ncbi:hypothetical protein FA13DRAFT_1729606 [Coprinellus micaceus]|uniref:GRIP domain-containing protein n=1 Tax=Coprinellus micaceus TaxID=71717 RepID=A0A4Y7TIW5_COPMI|nr:hypothetical protein FA13DRAFT_1729606 [Coprinellus micaceus]